MDNLDRKLQFKYNSRQSWKETFRQRCHEQLRAQRQAIIDRNRKCAADSEPFVRELISSQWQQMEIDFDQFKDGKYFESVRSLMEEVELELLAEEKRILAEFELCERHDEALVRLANEDEVICPMCQKSRVFFNQGILFCSCGMRINTEQDCVTLAMLQANLTDSVTSHSSACTSVPQFSVMHEGGVETLLMSCQTCDFMAVIV